jgi:anti-sigma regulatory factor (Ser/Thr protein kinase)
MEEAPNVRLRLSNRSENVLLVREMLTGVAEALDLESSDLYDIRTAVTEACNNVVLHAYEGGEGPLEVDLTTSAEAIEVVVRDHGIGIRPRIRSVDEAALGIGLPLIQALVQSVEFSEMPDGKGTSVRMHFQTPGRQPLDLATANGQEPLAIPSGDGGAAVIGIVPARLARAVLPRVLSVLAARAHFSTDRISDAQMLADALAAHAPTSLGADRVDLAVNVDSRRLGLRVGPLDAGRADRLILDSAVDGLGVVIEKLIDERSVASVGSAEMLELQLVDRQ